MCDLNLTPGQPKGSETILSEEMWEKILLNLKDPSDVLNAGKTCKQFQRILQSKTIEAYFAKTLPILMNYMDGKSILKCRSVSKGWMNVVDGFFENYFLGRTILGPDEWLKPFPATGWASALYSFHTEYWRDRNRGHGRFMKEMKDHPRNPFVGRAVYFNLEGQEDRQEFQTVYNFFEIFGKHIWTLQLNISEEYSLEVEMEDIFRFIIKDVFELAPNLKNLYIKNVPLLTVSMSKDEIRALTPAQGLEKLEITEAFMPYREEYRESEEVEKAILLRHSKSQLTVLHTKTLDPLRNLNYWPNLKQLHFTNIESEGISELDVTFRNLRLPKLELLSISLDDMRIPNDKQWKRRGQKMAFKKFFLGLHHLCTSSPNLKTLRLDTSQLLEKHSNQRLGFPRGLPCPKNIKTLEVQDNFYRDAEFYGTSDYSFLLRFPHVENIHVVHVYRDIGLGKYSNFDRREHQQFQVDFFMARIRNEIVKVHKFMYSGRMYESNIWELLPFLKVLSMQNCGERTYTRSSYERRRLAIGESCKLKMQN